MLQQQPQTEVLNDLTSYDHKYICYVHMTMRLGQNTIERVLPKDEVLTTSSVL
jgi:hypothetical protein